MLEVVLERFLEEARDLLDQGSKGLLLLERAADDPALVNTVFRAFHTMKGSSALFDFRPMTRSLHAGEDLLQEVREARASLNSDKVDLLLAVLDHVKDWLKVLEDGAPIPESADAAADALVTRARKLGGEEIASEVKLASDSHLAATSEVPEWLRFSTSMPEFVGQSLVGIEYDPDPSCFFTGDDPLRLVSLFPSLLHVGIIEQPREPTGAACDPFECRLGFRVVAFCTLEEARTLLTYVADQVKLYEFSVGFGPEVDLTLRVLRESVQALHEPCAPALASARRLSHVELVRRVIGASGFPLSWAQEFELAVEAASALDSDKSVQRAVERVLDHVATAGRCGKRLSMLPRAASSTHLVGLEQIRSVRVPSLRPPGLPATPRSGSPRAVDPLDLPALHARVSSPPRALNAAPARAARPAADTATAQVYKVDQARIDSLLDLAGELLVMKNALPYLARRAESTLGAATLAREIKDQASVLTRIADSLHHAVMQLRIIPLSHVFDRFPRLVRDLSKQLGKQVRLDVVGDTTEADKSTVEKLAEPLIHIVRNSLDHGLETAEERVAAGKPTEGVIRLCARQDRGSLFVSVSDDGRGMDPEKMRATAIRRGILNSEQAVGLSDDSAIQLIFRAGFSTKEAVSDLSGRGVGMDVVKTAIDSCGGTVQVHGKLGAGTEVELTFPLSMAVTRVLLVEAERCVFGVPFDLVLETVHVLASEISDIRGVKAVSIRERVVPIVWLRDLLALEHDPPGARSEERFTLLLARLPAGDVGIVVDGFQEAVDVILKPLEGPLIDLRGYLGSSMLGDGRALLVLNLSELL